jgi:hypothetical protein
MSPAADTTTAKVFPFFKLARELRNRVYDNMAQDKAVRLAVIPSSDTELQFRRYLFPHLLTTSRQFSTEYQEETFRQTELLVTLSGRYVACSTWVFSALTKHKNLLRKVQTVEIRLICQFMGKSHCLSFACNDYN